MRWSPRASIVPPRSGAAVAADHEAVRRLLDVRAQRAQAVHARPRSGRSPSRRSSPAPRTTVSPSAKAPSSATSVSSSIASGTSSGSTSCPRAAPRPRPARRPARRRLSVPGVLEVADDHRAHALGDPEEAGAGPVEAHVRRPPRASRARACGGHHERGRRRVAGHGDARSSSSSSTCGDGDASARRARTARARGAASARCGRGSARARSDRGLPSASIPAISTHDLTWALATGSS